MKSGFLRKDSDPSSAFTDFRIPTSFVGFLEFSNSEVSGFLTLAVDLPLPGFPSHPLGVPEANGDRRRPHICRSVAPPPLFFNYIFFLNRF